jgi:hypothetical protein
MLVQSMSMPAIQDLAKKSFVKGLSKPAGDVRRLFHRETGDWSSAAKRIVEVDRERYASVKAEGQNSKQRRVAQGYTKDVIRKTISVTRKLSGEAVKALEAHGLAKFSMGVGEDVVDRIELDMTNFIGYGVASSYTDMDGVTVDTTTGDGLSLFNALHTLKYTAVTYSNIVTGAPSLSESSLELAQDYFNYNVLDNFGQKVSMNPNTLITTRKATMVNRATRLLKSSSPEKIAGTANANDGVVNTYREAFTHLIVEFDVDAKNITDTSKSFYWMLAALGSDPATSLQAYYVSWMSPTTAPVEIDQDAWVMSQTGRAAYGLGALSGRGICVSQATS